MKAAITADVIQGITMIIISFGVIAQGIYESGGVEKAYVINKAHGMYLLSTDKVYRHFNSLNFV